MSAPLIYRALVAPGLLNALFPSSEMPTWVRELKGQSGVYVIRSRDKKTLYVGESHSGRLHDTLTRHFRAWSGRTAGKTYSRGSVEVAIRVTSAGRAVPLQNALIKRLKPRDNVVGVAVKSDDPF